ncbi:PHP domain-like protein [Nadsonia fulvescens var. elongata DSM 6958]|uniref:PHP domain-like protein n=1 Tax=Nadsonia fulvescens var. elongata DSM 6958 TaxID=857566 RepID=A0A1E3PNG4_9ASCO|nr:PHP domain-like protein [Nadsonia fulvescens var. elongata DSM 6958]
MFTDLNVPWPAKDEYSAGASTRVTMDRVKVIIKLLEELGFTCIALNYFIKGKFSSNMKCPIPNDPFSEFSPRIKFLKRVTVIMEDVSQNFNFSYLNTIFDIVAVRPTSEKTFQNCCTNPEIDIISFDLTQRLPFFLKHKTACAAVEKGLKFEITYSPSLAAQDKGGRVQLISNASSLIRATRARGLIVASEAIAAGQLRGPYDIINLISMWGLDHMRARNCITTTSIAVIKNAHYRKNVYKQVIQPNDVVTSQNLDHAINDIKGGVIKEESILKGKRHIELSEPIAKRTKKQLL